MTVSSRRKEVMKKQIVQILHNLIERRVNPDGSKPDSEMSHTAESVKSVDVQHGASAVQVVDQKIFERIVNESLSVGQGKGCLLVCNVDRFREINDIYGRDSGDDVLRYMLSILCDVFRECDCIGSTGSDKFLLWLSEISLDDVEEVRRQVGVVNDRLLHPTGGLPPVSISAGAAFAKSDDDCKSLGKKANKILSFVKDNGRCGCEMSL